MAHRDTAQAAGAATAVVERALRILGPKSIPKSVHRAKAVLDSVLEEMRIVCIDLTGDEGEPAGGRHTPGPVRSGRAKRNTARADTASALDRSNLAGAHHVDAVSNAREQRLASRRQAEGAAQGAPAPGQVCKKPQATISKLTEK